MLGVQASGFNPFSYHYTLLYYFDQMFGHSPDTALSHPTLHTRFDHTHSHTTHSKTFKHTCHLCPHSHFPSTLTRFPPHSPLDLCPVQVRLLAADKVSHSKKLVNQNNNGF